MLKIAGREPCSIVDGEGLRYVIFFQGCKHFCKGCHNKETWNFCDGINSNVENELQLLSNNVKYIDGVTISGGDPFFQYNNLVELCKQIKTKFNLNIWVYTGFTLNELKNKGLTKIFNYIDTLVDGKFIEELKDYKCKFVGSSNQNIIYLKNIV